MNYWLLKSEPNVWSWAEQAKVKSEAWTGVRNHQASANLRAMRVGDEAFFYHSNIGKEIVGIVRVTRAAYPDPTDDKGKFVCVDVAAVRALARPVTLDEIKGNPALAGMALLRQSRLSVQPVTVAHWKIISQLA